MVHPREIAFFGLGVALTNVPLARIAGFLRRWSAFIAVMGVAVIWYELHHCNQLTPAGIAAYMSLSMAAALWWERLWPRSAKLIARLGETVFFVYVLHILVIDLGSAILKASLSIEAAELPPWLWLLAVPIIYLTIHALGMGIKQRSPKLFELLAIRPPKKTVGSGVSGALNNNPGRPAPDWEGERESQEKIAPMQRLNAGE